MRAKAGKKQSSNDASGRVAHSAGASLRRYNELALKKVLITALSFRLQDPCLGELFSSPEIVFLVYLLICENLANV